MKKLNLHRFAGCRKPGAFALAAAIMMSLAACGKTDSTDEVKKEWAYVPEFVTIEDERMDYYNMQLMGENLYSVSLEWDENTNLSTQSICKYSLADKTVTQTPVVWPEGAVNMNINETAFTEDGSLYAIVYSYSEDGVSKNFLTKFDGEGKWLFSQEITDLVADSYINDMAVDGEGRVYLAGDGNIWLLDAEGNQQGKISMDSANSWIDSIVCGKDGKMYITYQSYNESAGTSEYALTAIDFAGKKLGESYAGLPGNSSKLAAGTEYDFLVHDSTHVYGYSLEKQESELLFDWLDSDINGNSVRNFGELSDGRIAVIIEDWETNDNGIALLTKKKAEEVPEKETIVVATISGGYNLQGLAVQFNKANSQYHISVKEYYDYNNGGENAWADALTNLNNDITSNNCPDIIDLSGLSVEQLAAKGVFENLSPYLEKSSVLNRADFIENILNVYTFDDVLVSIPSTFSMQTIIGSADMVGEKSGWTLDEMIALAEEHPDAEIFDKVAKREIMQAMMMFNEDAFIDWSTGECNFNSDEFKKMLEFVNRFPDEVDWQQDGPSTPTRIQNGEVLLDTAYLYDFDQIQLYEEIFQGKAVCVGFPTMDGTGGHALSASNAYAISTKSNQKDGAWAFIESVLNKEDSNNRYWNGFPTVKSQLDAMIAEATKVEYATDENGEVILDESGEAIAMGSHGVGYEDGWSYDFRTPTQEEVDVVLALMDEAKPVFYGGEDEVMKIINEEAEGYYSGQKSVDEVVGVIQSRVQIYVSENK